MKKLSVLLILGFCLVTAARPLPSANVIGKGRQPQVSVDNKGVVRVVYGEDDKIFCATSTDHGQTFTKPMLIAQVPDMHLGMSRGPQLVSSANYSVITAIDKAGSIHWFRLNNASQKWQPMGVINDIKGSAPEGLMAIAADKKDNFYAVWLDIRTEKSNQIAFAMLSGSSTKWSTNRLIYRSPDMHVCECCKPNITVSGATVAVMFRNWLNGSRDLYVLRSDNSGQTFSAAQKMGLDTWKLNGCPMDGGGIRINSSNIVETVWQRKGDIYLAKPGEPEMYIGKGKTCSIVGTGMQTRVVYQNNDTLKAVSLPGKKQTNIGTGSFLRSAALTDKSSFYVWEQDNKINYIIL